MLAPFYDLTFMEYADFIGMADGGETVGDGNGRTVLHQLFKRILYHAFAFGIEGGSRFVQDEDRRILQNGAGNADALALTAGELTAPVANHGVISLLACHDEIVCIGNLGCFHHLFHSGIFYPEGNVVEEGIIEQNRFLVHITHDATEVMQGGGLHVYTINQDFTFLYIVVTGNQVHHGRLSRAGLTYQSNGLALFDGEVDVLQNPLRVVLERYVLEFYLFLQRTDMYRIGYLWHLVFCHENLVHTFHARQALRDVVAGSGEFLQRVDEAIEHHQIEDEGRSGNGAVVVQNQSTPKPQYNDNQNGSQELAHRMSHLLTGVDTVDGVSVLVVGVHETFVHLVFCIESLDDTETAQCFFQLCHEVTPLVLRYQ